MSKQKEKFKKLKDKFGEGHHFYEITDSDGNIAYKVYFRGTSIGIIYS